MRDSSGMDIQADTRTSVNGQVAVALAHFSGSGADSVIGLAGDAGGSSTGRGPAAAGATVGFLALPPAITDHSPVAACGADELCEWLFPHLSGLYVEQVQPAGAGVVMQARSRAAGAACPACGAWASRAQAAARPDGRRTASPGPWWPGPACSPARALTLSCRASYGSSARLPALVASP
jgi:hypothetical protein